MPALNYQKQFAPKVESGEKRQTIRAVRKDGRDPRPGQTLYQYTGMRTKACRKLREDVCLSTTPIVIDEQGIVAGGKFLTFKDIKELALADGFSCTKDFRNFFQRTHGLPFFGLIIRW